METFLYFWWVVVTMELTSHIQDQILSALSSLGGSGSTITEIERKVKFERHTLSKYLSFMQANGVVYHKTFGKAKVWFINKAPLQTVLMHDPEHKTFTERILSDLISDMPYGLFVVDRDYNILFLNAGMKELYGDVSGEKLYSAVLGVEHPLQMRSITAVLRGTKERSGCEVADSEGRVLTLKVSPLLTPDGSTSFIIIVDDISAQRKAEELLREKTELLEAEREALNSSAIVAETNLDGIITYVNDQFVKLSGYKRDEILGQTHALVNSGHHSPQFFTGLWKTISSGKVWNGKIRNKAKNGKLYWTDTTIAPVLGKDGTAVKYLAIRYVV
tara:strand:- start:183 stop:1175 length:993 start_codon:yes stop_codon:yes gene_type:complete